jgi:hypothetical protein
MSCFATETHHGVKRRCYRNSNNSTADGSRTKSDTASEHAISTLARGSEIGFLLTTGGTLETTQCSKIDFNLSRELTFLVGSRFYTTFAASKGESASASRNERKQGLLNDAPKAPNERTNVLNERGKPLNKRKRGLLNERPQADSMLKDERPTSNPLTPRLLLTGYRPFTPCIFFSKNHLK